MSNLNDDRCVLCLDKKRTPVHINCGHSFCYECLNAYKSYQKHAWAKKCPICRRKLQEQKPAVKRKFISSNATTENQSTTSNVTETNSRIESSTSGTLRAYSSAPLDQAHTLEAYMALADDYDNDSSSLDEASQNVEDLTNDNDDYDDNDNDDENAFSSTDSEEDSYYYYFDEDEDSLNHNLNVIDEDYLYDFAVDNENAVVEVDNDDDVDNSDVVILDDVIVID